MSKAKIATPQEESFDLVVLADRMQEQKKVNRERIENSIESAIARVRELRKKGMINRNGSFEIEQDLIIALAVIDGTL